MEYLYCSNLIHALFSVGQNDAEHKAVTYVIELSDIKTQFECTPLTYKPIARFVNFLLREKFLKRSLVDIFLSIPVGTVGDKPRDWAIFKAACHVYLQGRGATAHCVYERTLQTEKAVSDGSLPSHVNRLLKLPVMAAQATNFATEAALYRTNETGFSYSSPLSRITRALTRCTDPAFYSRLRFLHIGPSHMITAC